MQIQRVNMQSSIAQSKQNKAKGEPAFGMKIYMDKQLAKNVLSDADEYVNLAMETKDSNVIAPLVTAVKNFIECLPKGIAEHNVNPENHRLFNNEVNIDKIEIGYFHPKNGFLSLADSSGDKFPIKSSGNIILKHFEEFSKKSNLSIGSLLKARIKTDTGAELSSGPLGSFMHKDNFKILAGRIQEQEIVRLEVENPDLYWDMIQRPSDTTVITIRQSNKH